MWKVLAIVVLVATVLDLDGTDAAVGIQNIPVCDCIFELMEISGHNS